MKKLFYLLLLLASINSHAQELKLKKRQLESMTGSEFARSISDTSLSLEDREKLIYTEIKNGNVPDFLRKLSIVQVEKIINTKNYVLTIYTTPDYLVIGNDDDFFYLSITPILAQKIASLTNAILPTKAIVDEIYNNAKIKLEPQPIPPSKAMTTVPVFITHNGIILKQLEAFKARHQQSELTAGNKKDIIISNKIFGQPTPRVVIYGWHKLDGKAIQPVYNKHTNTWADYSHGVRLVSEKAVLNGKKVKLTDLLKDSNLCELLSDEGIILKSKYPLN
ncbi:hypothetical protein [Pedobacter xixiisoli]|uniref:Uncharacterized protein n=1 Tax=Pedobacter xixiisoli TaxID=1476464 RepID=A0A285ZU57_9SPHI|nr:hypothetical protein [Pedobacter xixiisoli]SOD13158.1 hypothetical protein SAMN06297358_1038 [Pedobacter xixiisoli]